MDGVPPQMWRAKPSMIRALELQARNSEGVRNSGEAQDRNFFYTAQSRNWGRLHLKNCKKKAINIDILHWKKSLPISPYYELSLYLKKKTMRCFFLKKKKKTMS